MSHHWRELFERKYIGAWDIPEDRDSIVEIDRVVGGELTMQGGVKNKKPLIYFKNVSDPSKPMAAGATVCKTIESLLGTGDHTKWGGHKIVLYRSMTETKDGQTPCVRVRPFLPKGKLAAAPILDNTTKEREPGEEEAAS